MREQWYGDNRDLVKWAKLVELARRNKVQTIIQIAMLRPSNSEWELATSELPAEVLQHFRKLTNIHRLGEATKLQILVWDERSCKRDCLGNIRSLDRDTYFSDVVKRLREVRSKRLIAFLDPDTGLEPENRPGPKHVNQDELRAVYAALKPRDWLVLYQHAPRLKDGNTWIVKNHEKFARFLHVPRNRVETLSAPRVAGDVVLFAVRKTTGRA